MKRKIINIIVPLVFFVVFNVCWFAIIEIATATRWICYAAINISYLLLWMSMHSIPEVKGSFVYGYPKVGVASFYFFLVLFFGVVIAFVNPASSAWPIVIFTVITGGFLLMYAALMKSEEWSIANDKKDDVHLYFIRNCSAQLHEIMMQSSDSKQRKQVEQVYDAIRNAQISSVPQAAAIESQIVLKIAEIQSFIGDILKQKSAVNEILTLIRQRDMLISSCR